MSSRPIGEKEALCTLVSNMYGAEGCGICEGKGAEVFWFSRHSKCAHEKCYKQIKAAESALTQVIDDFFKDKEGFEWHKSAHEKAIKAVRKVCGPGTILSYMEKNGAEALKNLFNTVGVEAAKRYAAANL